MTDPTPAPPPARTSGVALSIVTANFWRENPQRQHDAAVLAGTKATLVGVNEGKEALPVLRKVAGYDCCVEGSGPRLQNPVLVRDGVVVLDVESRQLCDAVGSSPARAGTCVKYELAGEKRAHIQTHLNAHIENGGEPRDLPRVKEAVRHMVRLEAWIRELVAAGYRVTVAGDFNWAWTKSDARDWRYSPEAVFARLGMVTQFDHETAIAGGTLGKRRIDYIAYFPDDLELVSQRIVPGEHSDHRWILAAFVTR